MKKAKISDSELKLIVILAALAMLACAYFFGYNMCLKNAMAIEQENEAEKAEIARLKDMVAKRPEIEAQTERYRQDVRDVIAKYPVDVPEEKAIYLLQGLEDETNVLFSSISFSLKNLVANVSSGVSGYYTGVTMAYGGSYEDFKKMVDYVHGFDDRMVIPTVNASYDETTGNLSGSINIKMYYLTGTDKEYEELPNLGIESGKECIFGGSAGGQLPGGYDAGEQETEGSDAGEQGSEESAEQTGNEGER